jgi:nitroreductase
MMKAGKFPPTWSSRYLNARWAPSGGNGQPWEFVVVRDQDTRYKIADFYIRQMEQKREMDLAVRGTAKVTGDGFRRAPVHIISR